MLQASTPLQRFVLPALATSFEVTKANAKVADLVLFSGTALAPAVAAVAGQACLAGIVSGEGWVGHEEVAWSKRDFFMRTSIRHDGKNAKKGVSWTAQAGSTRKNRSCVLASMLYTKNQPERAAETVAAALADGVDPDAVSEAISLAGTMLVLGDPGRKKEWSFFPDEHPPGSAVTT